MNSDELAGIIEGILFGAGDGVSITELCRCLDKPVSEVQFAMEILRQDYQSKARGIRLVQVKDSYQLSTKPDLEQAYSEHQQVLLDRPTPQGFLIPEIL